MVRREDTQISLADALIYQRVKPNNVLIQIDAHVDWEPLRRKMENQYRTGGPGRPGYPVVTMFKVLILQNLYNLSDPAAEEAITDRISFRKFLGLNLDQPVPDYSTIHRFRDRIAPIVDDLFAMMTQQMESKNLILKKGTLIDASIIESSARPPLPGVKTSSDQGATWTKKNQCYYYGYRAHLGLDQSSELIRRAEFTPANINDARLFKKMVSGDEDAVYADRAYFGYERSDWLKEQGIADYIMAQVTVDKRPQKDDIKAFNRAAERVRKSVEHVFGTLKRHYSLARCRYYTLLRNRCHYLMMCICYNLKRQNRLLQAV